MRSRIRNDEASVTTLWVTSRVSFTPGIRCWSVSSAGILLSVPVDGVRRFGRSGSVSIVISSSRIGTRPSESVDGNIAVFLAANDKLVLCPSIEFVVQQPLAPLGYLDVGVRMIVQGSAQSGRDPIRSGRRRWRAPAGRSAQSTRRLHMFIA